MSKTSNGTTNVAVKNSSIGWVVAIIAACFIIPGLFGAGLGVAGNAADSMTKPIPGNAKRLNQQSATTPTTAAPKMTDQELQARMQAKATGDGLAAARIATPAPQVDPRGGLPSIDGSGSGGILGELPAIGGAVRALTQGGGLKALNP